MTASPFDTVLEQDDSARSLVDVMRIEMQIANAFFPSYSKICLRRSDLEKEGMSLRTQAGGFSKLATPEALGLPFPFEILLRSYNH